MILDVEAVDHKLRVLPLDVLEIALGAITFIAPGLVEKSSVDRWSHSGLGSGLGARYASSPRFSLSLMKGSALIAFGHRRGGWTDRQSGDRGCGYRGEGNSALLKVVLDTLPQLFTNLVGANQGFLSDEDLGNRASHHFVLLFQTKQQIKVCRLGDAPLLDDHSIPVLSQKRLQDFAMHLFAGITVGIVEVQQMHNPFGTKPCRKEQPNEQSHNDLR